MSSQEDRNVFSLKEVYVFAAFSLVLGAFFGFVAGLRLGVDKAKDLHVGSDTRSAAECEHRGGRWLCQSCVPKGDVPPIDSEEARNCAMYGGRYACGMCMTPGAAKSTEGAVP